MPLSLSHEALDSIHACRQFHIYDHMYCNYVYIYDIPKDPNSLRGVDVPAGRRCHGPETPVKASWLSGCRGEVPRGLVGSRGEGPHCFSCSPTEFASDIR